MIGYFPTSANPDEIFTIVILDIVYNVRQLYNTLGFWTLSFSDADEVEIVLGVKVVPGAYLLAQYPELRFDLKLTKDDEVTRDSYATLEIGIYEK